MWQLEIAPAVTSKVQKIPEPERGRIKRAIARLAEADGTSDVKRLSGHEGYRLRVGDWRIFFDIDPHARLILITRIAPRGEAYKQRR